MSNHHRRDTITHGVALTLYPIFLGFAPVLGKFALNGQSDPFTVAALRTLAAAGMLWIIYLLFWRKYIYIYPAGLLGCIVIGTVNGIGSLFYYNGLSYLNASVAQLLNATYLIFVVILAAVDGQKLNGRTVLRVILAFTAVAIITQGQAAGGLNWHGIGLMIGNAILFAGTFMLGQRVTYEMPSTGCLVRDDHNGCGGCHSANYHQSDLDAADTRSTRRDCSTWHYNRPLAAVDVLRYQEVRQSANGIDWHH